MKINIVTIFPKLIETFLSNGIFQRAIDKGIVAVNIYNLRDFSSDRLGNVDDAPYGGGRGMVLKVEPFINLFNKIDAKNIIFPSPQGVKLDNRVARELSSKEEITLICGHYEGIDERVMKHVDLEVSLGDYVISGGELASLIILDATLRFVPKYIKSESTEKDSFERSLLDSAPYTRPSIFESDSVPKELMSGNHSLIEEYRRKDAIYRTLIKRPDLLTKLNIEDREYLKRICLDILKHI